MVFLNKDYLETLSIWHFTIEECMAKIVIYSPNVMGKSMAGPSIRVWEFAKALSNQHTVTVVAPNSPDIQSDTFQLISVNDPRLKTIEKKADAIILQNLPVMLGIRIKKNRTRIIIDAYDPLPLEILEQYKDAPIKERDKIYSGVLTNLLFNFRMADGIICASEKQRDLWLGLLMGQGLIDPARYNQDTSLRNYIDVVPFGLSSTPPKKTGTGLRELFKFKQTDKVLLWGGGIWNWFDPLTLIKAVHILSKSRSDIKLVFMGLKNPDPSVPDMAMAAEAVRLSKELGLYDKQVFFNFGWVPYDERQNYLLEADIGVSTHFDHLETRFSFRTRMLDYIWAKLPILATRGDSFADLVEQKQLGVVVGYENPEETAQSILSLVDNPDKIKQIKKNLEKIQHDFHWEHVVEPINKMVNLELKDSFSLHHFHTCSDFFIRKIREKGLAACLLYAFKRVKKYGQKIFK